MVLRQLENDTDRDVRASTNVSVVTDDSQLEESLDTNHTKYLDETIECEPSMSTTATLEGGAVPKVVVVADEDLEPEEQNQTEQKEESRPDEPLP